MKFKLLTVSAIIGLMCQFAYADKDTDYDLKSLADAPINLVNKVNVQSGASEGVKPNVMLFIDDSGSMRSGTTDNPVATNHRGLPITDQSGRPIEKSFGQTVSGNCDGGRKHAPAFGDNRANPRDLCFFSLISTLAAAEVHPIKGTMNLMVNPSLGLRYSVAHVQFTEADEKNVRLLIVMNAVHDVLDTYGDLINWNIFTLHGSEDRYSSTARPLETQRHENSSYTNIAQGRVTHRLYWGAQALSSAKPFMEAKDMRKYINSLSPLLGTPTTERYTRAAKIVADNIQYRCQKSYIVLLSDGDANGSNVDIQTKWRGQEGPNMEKLFNHKGKFALRGTQLTYNGKNYTDNDGEVFQGIGPLATSLHEQDMKNSTSPNATKATGCSSSVGLDAECQSWDDEKHKIQNIETFTIGFGQSLSAKGRNYLTNGGQCNLTEEQIFDKEIADGKTESEALKIADSNGDGKITATKACFFNAAESTQLASAFKHIFSAIEAANTTSNNGQKSLSISSSTTAGATTAESAVLFSLDTKDWSSELKLAKLKADGITLERDRNGKPIYLLASYDDRRVVANFNGQNRELSANDHAQFGFLNKSEFEKGLFPWLIRKAETTDLQIEANVAGLSLSNRVVKAYRNREGSFANNRHMADVVGASNIAVGRDKNNRQKYIMTAANDGMVYIFKSNEDNATFNAKPYSLVMNYLPASMQREKNLTVANSIQRTAEADYGTNTNPHIYLNNGGITWILTSKTGNKKQQYIAFGNMGQGARGAYVLNMGGEDRKDAGSIPVGLDAGNDIVKNVPFWETEKGNNNKLGYTISAPIAGQISIDSSGSATGPLTDMRTENVVLGMFLANGYSTEDNSVPYDASPTLYVYNAMGQEFGTSIKDKTDITNGTAGQLIRAIPTGFNKAGALSTPILLDADLNGIYDYAFAGDEFGNLWQFNIYGAPSSWRAYQIYRGTLNGDGKSTMPITASPEIYRVHGRERNHANFNKEFVVVFGTGSDVYDSDLKDDNRQALMGIYVDVTAPVNTPHQQNSNFLDQTMTNIDGSDINQKENDNQLKLINPELAYTNGHVGWRIWLRTASTYQEVKKDTPLYKETHTVVRAAEKITTNPQILMGTVIVTTRMYEHTADIKIERKNQNSAETCGLDITTEETKSGGDSLLLAVNAVNGGNPDLLEGAYIKDRTNEKGEAEGFKANASVQKVDPKTGQITSEPNQEVGIIGKSLGGLASGAGVTNINAMNTDTLQGTNYGSSGSGLGIVRTLEEGTPAGQTAGYTDERVACLDNSGKYVVGATVANEDNPYSAFEFDGKRCQTNNSFIRVNWREVSF